MCCQRSVSWAVGVSREVCAALLCHGGWNHPLVAMLHLALEVGTPWSMCVGGVSCISANTTYTVPALGTSLADGVEDEVRPCGLKVLALIRSEPCGFAELCDAPAVS